MKELMQPWAGPDPPIVPPHLVVDAVARAQAAKKNVPDDPFLCLQAGGK